MALYTDTVIDHFMHPRNVGEIPDADGKGLHTTPELQAQVMKLKPAKQITDASLLKRCLFVLALTMGLFVAHGALGLESATAAMFGAGLLRFSNTELLRPLPCSCGPQARRIRRGRIHRRPSAGR